MKKRYIALVTGVQFAILFIGTMAASAGTVVMNVQASNSTSEPRQGMRVVRYLPPELKKSDILEMIGLELRFDEKKSAYYLYTQVDLQPDEVRQFRVVINDIWMIPQDDIGFLKKQIGERVKFLEGTDDHPAAVEFAKVLTSELDAIAASQAESGNLTVEGRIESYRLNLQSVNDIRGKTTVMSDFTKEAKWHQENLRSSSDIRFVIEAKNPFDDEPQENVEVKRYLPRGVEAVHVIDAQGFDVKFDPEEQLYYLTKKITFKPAETITHVISIKNVWQIADSKIDSRLTEAKSLSARLKDTPYQETGLQILKEIEQLALAIRTIQADAETPLDRISNFSMNLKRLSAIDDGVKELVRLVKEVENPVPQVVPYEIKPATPDISTTWKFIYGMIAFLSILGALFYLLWWGQSKAKMGQKIQTYRGE